MTNGPSAQSYPAYKNHTFYIYKLVLNQSESFYAWSGLISGLIGNHKGHIEMVWHLCGCADASCSETWRKYCSRNSNTCNIFCRRVFFLTVALSRLSFVPHARLKMKSFKIDWFMKCFNTRNIFTYWTYWTWTNYQFRTFKKERPDIVCALFPDSLKVVDCLNKLNYRK